ncbi:MAG TPA: dihydrofolate reductase family protein [Candidatus Binatia bacterium]|nr:dihydrofolate reductase family protein [Candidatus Binatia bacterium]
MQASVFIGTSVDGFIARLDDKLDFLPADGGEPHGYMEFFAGIDTILIGRRTFEIVLAFPEWPYGDKRVVVLSSRPLDFSTLRGANIEQMSGSPAEIVAKLTATGAQHAYVDGGVTIQQFLCAGLIQRLTITRVPVLIGQGISLFSTLPHDIRLRHIATQSYPSGLVKTQYEVLNG